jgi:hypothetical protein
MKNIEAHREMNKENLYSFYLNIGENSGFINGSISSARFISNASMDWPSYILGGGKMSKKSLLEIFNLMKDGTLPFFWLRVPDEDPDFDDFAEENAIRKINYWRGMNLKKETPFKLPVPSSDLVFEKIVSAPDMKEWLQLINQEIMTHRKLEIKYFLNVMSHPSFRFFRVLKGKKTVSTILIYKRSTEAGIYLVSTLLSERSKGIGRWITASAIDCLIDDGCREFVLHATPMGYPVYRKLGFNECCDYGVYWMLGRK